MEEHTMSNEQQVVTHQFVNYILAMRDVEAVFAGYDTDAFTAGYIQALDDLAAWLKKEELDS